MQVEITWFKTGFILAISRISVICLLLKFETPIDFTRPFSTKFSIAGQVSMYGTSLYATESSAFFGNKSSPS